MSGFRGGESPLLKPDEKKSRRYSREVCELPADGLYFLSEMTLALF